MDKPAASRSTGEAAWDVRLPRLAVRTAGVLLSGAHVWNENSLEFHCPRGLLPVANLPLIDYQLRWLHDAGVELVLICTNDRPGEVQDAVDHTHQPPPAVYFYEDTVPRGPAGCARDAADIVAAEQYVLVDGSILPDFELRGLLEHHQGGAADVTVTTCRSSARRPGPGQRPAPAGVYVFERAALAWAGRAGYQDLKETVLPRLYTEGVQVVALDVGAPVHRIHCRASYLAAQAWGLQHRRLDKSWSADHRWQDAAAIHCSARVSPTATLVGPVIVGPECQVEAQAVIVGPTALGRGCQVQRGAVVVQSVLWEGVQIGAAAGVYECVLARRASVEPGWQCIGELSGAEDEAASPQARRRPSSW